MNRRMLLLLGFVALLVVFTSWLSRKSEAPAPQGRAAAESLPDYFMRGIDSRITDREGNISHRLTAESLFHYPENDLSELEQPDVTILGENRTSWRATALSGRIEGDAQQLLLQGDVRLRQHGENELNLQTDWLQIDTARHYAQTDAPVTLEGPSTRVHGIGMQAYGDEQRLLLLSSVRGRYATE